MKCCIVYQHALCKGLPAVLIVLGLAFSAGAEQEPAQSVSPQTQAVQNSSPQKQQGQFTEPVHRVENQPTQKTTAAIQVATAEQAKPVVPQHPLVPALQVARAALANIDAGIQDYQCTLYKRERIGGKLGAYEAMFIKVRHEPFSVYMKFLGPSSVKDRECIYVANKNEGKLIAREGSGIKRMAGVFHLVPTGFLAMQGQKYPITELGIRNLTSRLIEVAENDMRFDECQVNWTRNAKIGTKTNARTVTCLEVIHPVPRKEFRFHKARIYIDDEWKVPIRYEAYLWPERKGGPPILDEEYTYMNFKFNNGFTDEDFEEKNKAYKFHN